MGVPEDDSGAPFTGRIQRQFGAIVRKAELCFAYFDNESFGNCPAPVIGIYVAAHCNDRGDLGEGWDNFR